MAVLRAEDKRGLLDEKVDLAAKLEALDVDYKRVRQRLETVDTERLEAEERLAEAEALVVTRTAEARQAALRVETLKSEQLSIELRTQDAKARLAEIEPLLPKRQQTKPPDVTDQVLEVAERFGTVSAKDVASALKIKPASATAALKRLVASGAVREGGKVLGQVMFEHLGAVAEQQEAAVEVKRSVRDFVCAQKEPFTPSQVTGATDVEGRELTESLQTMLRQGIIEYVGFNDLELYRYVKPTSAGAAAEKDAAKRAALAKQAPRSNGGGPVAGTGGKWKITDADVRATANMVEAAGGHVKPMPSGHYEVSAPGTKKTIRIAGTPGNRRTVLNDRARIRRELNLAV